jgi:hypothetical protein
MVLLMPYLFAAVSASWDMSKHQTSLTVHTVGDLASGYITCSRTDEDQIFQSSAECSLGSRGEANLHKFNFILAVLVVPFYNLFTQYTYMGEPG